MIDAKTLQTFLKTEGYYKGNIDGIFGPASNAGTRAALKVARVNATTWGNSRIYIALEQLFLNRVMNAGLIVDGLAGPKTNDALYTYNAQLLNSVTHNWPKQSDVRAGTSMFGHPGSANLVYATCPYVMYDNYDRKNKIVRFRAHSKVAASLERILQRTLDFYGPAKIKSLNLDINSGCYNYRPTTGSSTLSMHAWGVAIDIDYGNNQMDEGANEAAFSKPAYASFLDFFEDEGWVSLGRARNYDWMHFQAARL